jgi:hypothetical protein
MSVRTAFGWARSRPKLAAIGAVACLSLSGGAALAATHSSGPSFQQALLADAAKRLGVTPAALQAALKQAQIDQVNKAVADGKLTRAQADKIIAGIRAGHPMGPVAAPFFGFGGHHRFHGKPGFGFGHPMGPMGGLLGTAASYLHMTQQNLSAQLRGGKTLAQVAAAQDASVSGLEDALVNVFKSKLDGAVKAHRLTSTQEQAILDHVRTFVDDFVTGKFPRFGAGGPGGGGSGLPVPNFRTSAST